MATTTEIYQSRRTLVDILASRGFDVSEYTEFSPNEVDTMYNSCQLDMLVTRKSDGHTIYVKYHSSPVSKNIRTALDNMVEDLYLVEEILKPKDTLIVVVDDEPNEGLLAKMSYLFNHSGIFVVMHAIDRLQFNILEHVLVPRTEILTTEEAAEFMKTFRISDISQIPEISRFDPHALALCVRPGQICRFYRNSETALQTIYYRICV